MHSKRRKATSHVSEAAMSKVPSIANVWRLGQGLEPHTIMRLEESETPRFIHYTMAAPSSKLL